MADENKIPTPLDQDDPWKDAYTEFAARFSAGDRGGLAFEDVTGGTTLYAEIDGGELLLATGDDDCDRERVKLSVDAIGIHTALRISAMLAAWADHAEALLDDRNSETREVS